ncbi:MAG: 50S ribosomal protein L19 [Planctomycetota bacterium]|jgi:large subunit ribosomal protein L19
MSTPVSNIEKPLMKPELPQFEVGDQVAVAVLIREPPAKGSKDKEEKTRVQNFIGDVIAIQGKGIGRSFTVRRIVEGEGVERVFPFHSPLVKDVAVKRKGKVRRAKLYDLREKSGKAARIKERTGGTKAPKAKAGKPAAAPEQVSAEEPETTAAGSDA